MSIDYDALYPSFKYDRPKDGVLRITFDAPGLNAVDIDAHREIGEIWLTVDRDPDVQVAILQGAGKGFSAGGSFDLIDGMISDYAIAHEGDARGARPGVERDQLLEADRVGDPWPGGGCGAGRGPARRRVDRRSQRAHHRRPHPARRRRRRPRRGRAGRCCAAWRRRSTTCSPATADRAKRPSGSGSCRSASTTTRCTTKALEVADQLMAVSPSAVRWTKHALNHWYRGAGPAFDASLALEFYGFGGPDVQEGVASHREKRAANFQGPTSE